MVLLANDHLLKGAGVLPGWVTGKLSDLAGYFMFPSLLAVILRVRTQRGLLLCHLAAGLLLLLTELSPALCRLILAVSGHRLWPDPTDLVALCSIAVSWRILARLALSAESPRRVRDRRSKALILVGALASVATSPRRPPSVLTWAVPAEAFVQNERSQSLQIRLSAVRPDVVFDCESASRDPQALFSESQFTVVQHVTLGPGDAIPLQDPNTTSDAACSVFLLAVEGSPQRLVAWRRGTFTSGTSVNQSSGRVLISDTGLSASEGLLWPGPTEPTPPKSPACAAADPASEPTWSLFVPPPGPYSLRSLSKGSDGCSVLVLNRDSRDSRFSVCADPVDIPFVAGDVLSFRSTADGSDGLVIEGQSGGKAVTLSVIRRAYGLGAVALTPACAPVRAACRAGEAVAMSVPTLLGKTRPLASGEQWQQSDGATQVHVSMLRAETVRLADHGCDAQEALGLVGSYITLSTR